MIQLVLKNFGVVGIGQLGPIVVDIGVIGLNDINRKNSDRKNNSSDKRDLEELLALLIGLVLAVICLRAAGDGAGKTFVRFLKYYCAGDNYCANEKYA